MKTYANPTRVLWEIKVFISQLFLRLTIIMPVLLYALNKSVPMNSAKSNFESIFEDVLLIKPRCYGQGTNDRNL